MFYKGKQYMVVIRKDGLPSGTCTNCDLIHPCIRYGDEHNRGVLCHDVMRIQRSQGKDPMAFLLKEIK